MTKRQLHNEALQLATDERVDLALALWESVGQEAPVPAWHLELIRERLAVLEGQDPAARSLPWEDVRRRIWPRGE